MAKYQMVVRSISEWVTVIEADNEQAARDIAYDEVAPDLGLGDYVEMSAREIPSERGV
jgi:hypothetical protein